MLDKLFKLSSAFYKCSLDFYDLKNKSKKELKELGMGNWDGNIMLFPKELFDQIPKGLDIIDINEEESKFDPKSEDKDNRFGYLSFGIKAKARINLLNRIKLAGKKEDIIAKYPDLDLSLFIQRDPSGNLKYLEWEAKVLQSGKALAPEIADVIELFHKFGSNLDKKDIYQYKIEEFTELRDKLFEIRDGKLEEKKKYHVNPEELACGSKIVYNSDNFTVRLITNKAASVHFGLGTKWCIGMNNETYFEDYDSNNVIFFFIFDKKLKKDNARYKLAIAIQRDKDNSILEEQFFNATDQEIYGWNDVVTGYVEQHIDASLAEYNKVKEELSEIYGIVLSVSKDQPKSLVAKIASGEGDDNDFRKLYQVARNTNDSELQEKYLEIIFTKNNNVPEDVLRDIIKQGDYVWMITEYKKCPPKILEEILESDKYYMTSQVIENIFNNPNLPIEKLLEYLDYDGLENEITSSIYNRISSGPESLNEIIKIYDKIKNINNSDRINDIKYRIAANISCPPEILDSMVDEDLPAYIITNIVRNKNVSQETLLKIHQKWYNNKKLYKSWGDAASDAFSKIRDNYPEILKKYYPEAYHIYYKE